MQENNSPKAQATVKKNEIYVSVIKKEKYNRSMKKI